MLDRLDASTHPLTSAIAIYEATLGVARASAARTDLARSRVQVFPDAAEVRVVEVARVEGDAALDAHARFGKGRHPARLNMGDCLAYACARTHDAPLLFKGEDFALTDMIRA